MKQFSLVLLLITTAGLVRADLRSELEAHNRKLQKAALAKDAKGAEAAYNEAVTSDFKFVQDGKTQDYKTFMGNFKATIDMTEKVTSSSTRILTLKLHGKEATGEIEKKMAGTMRGPDKKIHTFDWKGAFTEEYKNVGGKWKTAKMTAGKQQFLMDGKPVKM